MSGPITQTPTLTTIANFSTSNGTNRSGVVFDKNGNLVGDAFQGGSSLNDGTIFEIVNRDGTFDSAPVTLITFPNIAGSNPVGGLSVDSSGNLFGATSSGGASNNFGAFGEGTVFELQPLGSGYSNAPIALTTFVSGPTSATTTLGQNPNAGVTPDAAGNLYGTTNSGGTYGYGLVFELPYTQPFPPFPGSYPQAPVALASFNGTNGQYPSSNLLVDASGNVFGTTRSGSGNAGEIYEVAAGSGSITVLATFTGSVTIGSNPSGGGASPLAGLVEDANGDLFGTTFLGGANGEGSVFELAYTSAGYASAPTILVSFNGDDGLLPSGGLLIDSAGNLFGTTSGNTFFGTATGAAANGTVFEIQYSTTTGYASTPLTLATFQNPAATGANPGTTLTVDASGNLFGTTGNGGTGSNGTVFEITNSGFATTACYREGTRLATPTGEVAVEALQPGDLVTTHSGRARPILWVGHRVIDCRTHSSPIDVLPIRISAHAFGPGLPARDLFVSPDHAVFAGGVLIPARYLVNGRNVVQTPCDEVRYFHVATETHDVVLAEGLPCETLLDADMPSRFDNAATAPVLRGLLAPFAPVITQGTRLEAVRHVLRSTTNPRVAA